MVTSRPPSSTMVIVSALCSVLDELLEELLDVLSEEQPAIAPHAMTKLVTQAISMANHFFDRVASIPSPFPKSQTDFRSLQFVHAPEYI